MKFIDILFVLSAAATANAILVSDNGNDSVQASSTSSQVSGPTNEPEPGTSRQGQQHLLHRTGPSAPKRIRKRIRKRPSGRPGSSTLDPDHKQPMYQPGPSAPKRSRKQPMNKGESGNTVSSQAVVLSKKDQKVLNRIKKRLEELEEMEKDTTKKYCEGIAYQFKECGVLEKEGHVHDPNYTPRTIKDSRKDYKEVRKLIVGIKEQLKTFMESRSLKYVESLSDAEEPKADSDSD
ncbi:hypothetical protein O5D80_006331 [Batrachochytrium dendrobatidis]|nr:hypothetical protein O5D80_006331 [Batrachochytrium dendrobatidis]